MKSKWPLVQLGTILDGLQAGVSVNSMDRPALDREVGVLKVSCVADGVYLPTENKAVLPLERARVAVRPQVGDILITRANTPSLVGACGYVDVETSNLFLPDKVWRTRVGDPSRDHARWVLHCLCSSHIRSKLQARATGTSAGMKNISKNLLLKIQVPRPSLAVQARIVAALDAMVASARATQALAVEKRRFKRALMQRLAPSPSDSKRVRLGEVTREITRRNDAGLGPERVMGVIKNEGLVPMREGLMADDLVRYRVVPPQAFAYNPMRVNIGSIAYSWHKDEILVSPDYVTFECDGGRLDPRYLDHIRQSPNWTSFMGRAGNGSVRVRIYYADLAQFAVALPTIQVQRKVARLLDALDKEVALLEHELGALRRQRRAVMQRLFTGEIDLPDECAPEPPFQAGRDQGSVQEGTRGAKG